MSASEPVTDNPPRPANSRAHLLALLAVLFVLQAVFHFGFQQATAPFFPSNFDQVDHRMAAAVLADRMANDGISGLVSGLIDRPIAQGFVHVMLGGFAMQIGVDPTYVVFALFLLTLAITWWALSDRGQKPWRGWAAVSLVLAMRSLIYDVGSALDFRPDFPGQALWTAATALALGSRVFRDRKFTLYAGAILGLVFCTRSLTLAYAVAASPALVLATWFGGDRDERRLRLLNLAMGVGLAGALALPFFLYNYKILHNYYITNHISLAENEARQFDGGLFKHLAYYLKSALLTHLGSTGLSTALLMLSAGLVAIPFASMRKAWPVFVIGLGFCSPLLVMSMGPQYSGIVAGSFSGSLALLALTPWFGEPRPFAKRLAPVAVGVIALSLLTWPIAFLRKADNYGQIRSARGHHHTLPALDRIIKESAGKNECVVSTLHLIESVSVPMLRLRSYTTGHGLGTHFKRGLGHSIYRQESKQVFFDTLRASDIAVYWIDGRSGGKLPANAEVDEYRTEIEEVLSTEFRKISPDEPWQVDGKVLEIYAKKLE